MNRVYKVIYNRTRNLYQVVSEIVHSRGKTRSLTAQHQHERLTTAILVALFAMGTSLPVGWAADTTVSTTVTKDDTNAVSGGAVYTEVRPTDDTTTAYVKSNQTTAQNLTKLDTQVKQNADTIANKADATALAAKADKTDLDAKANTSMDNLTDAGKQAIQALLDIKGSANVTVSSTTDDTNKTKTFTITVTDGTVANGNTGLVTGGTVYSEVRPSADGTYVKTTNTTAQNLTDLDIQVHTNANDISSLKNLSNISTDGKTAIKNLLSVVGDNDQVTVTPSDDTTSGTRTYKVTVKKDGAITADSDNLVTGKTVYEYLSTNIGTLAQNGNYIKQADSVSANLSTLDTQVKTNADAIAKETEDRTQAITNLTNTTNSNLATKANVDASDIGKNLKTADGSTETDAAKITSNQESWGEALGSGTIAEGNKELVTGGTLYSELRPKTDGTYVKSGSTTATNLTALDTQIKNVIDAIGLDSDNTTTSYTSKLNKYFKVNPEITTNTDNTKTYAADAAANGTNSVAIGPNAKTATYTTTVTSGDSTTTTETAADHAVAIGDGATVNAAGDQGVALGNGAVTGEAETSTSDGTTTTTTDAKGGESSVAIGDTAKASGNQALAFGKGASVLNPSGTAVSTGSTAIGSGAKVDGGDNSIALGTSATVNKVSDAMALGNGATINKTATGSIALGKSAVTGGTDKSITLTNGTTGTLAAAGGVDSIAIGNGAVSEGNEALALGKGAKVTNGATGGDSAAAIVKTGSAAIGDGASVYNSATSMAIGNGASISEGENTTVIGSSAKATQTKQAFVAGYQASSDSSAESSVAIGDNASTHSARTTAIGYKAEAHNADSIAIGSEAKTDDNGGGIAIGNKASVAQGGIAIGSGSTQANNTNALAIGNGAVADVNQSISIGYNAGVGTTEDYKERNGSLVAIGTSAGNNVKGMQNVAIGASAGSSVLSSNNIAIGTNAGYGIKNVTSDTDTNPQNGYNISIGAGANYTEGNTNQNIVSSIAIGHKTHAANRAVALGEGASASGDSGIALGNSATSSGSGSIAIGNTASASNGNIALGAGAIATDKPTGTGKWTNSVAPSYYISVGGKGNGSDSTITLRRISNVADGSADQDVVTVKQLQKVSDDLENTIKGIDTSQLKTYSTTEIDNKIAEVNQNIKDSGVKYFSINAASQSTNSNNTGANGDGDADAMAIGPNAKASSVKALAIGNNVSASGTLSIAIGTASNPSTSTTTAETPHPTSSEGTSSVAIGTSAIAQTDDSIAIGTRAATYTANTTSTPVSTVGVQSIAIGFSAETRDDNAVSIGTKSKANSVDAIAIGDGAEALNTNAVVIGKASTAEGSDSVTIGMSNANNGKAVITTGNSNQITNSQSVKDTVQNSGLYGSSNAISSVSSSNTSNAITDVYAVGNGNKLNQMGEKNVLTDVSIMGNQNTIENGTAGAYTQTVKQIAVVGSGNTVKGNTQVNEDTWGTVQRDTILGYKNTVDATNQSTPVSNLQILGNDVKATFGNSVYLGTGSSATASKSATAEAITLAKEQGDAEAIASDEYKKATTEAEQTAIKQKYEAQYIHAANIAAMDQDGISAGITNYDKDYTYGNDSAYTYAGSQATGVVTVGSKDATRRIQNVSAGLVGPNSTDAVNGSQLYALTRQIRFGGDNSTFGDVATGDVNVVAKGSNEKLAITGGAEGVSNTTTADGKSVTTVDGTKITDKNIAVIAEDDALHVKLASNLKNLNTAQLGKTTATTTKADDGTETTTYSYQETLKLDGTGDKGGTLALEDAKGENGVTLRTSGTTMTADVNGNATTRLLVNDKTVATTDDGLKFGGDTGTDSALKLNNKLNVKGGTTDNSKLTENNIGVVSDGNGTLTVKLSKNVNLGMDGSLTTGTVTATAVTADTVTSGNSTLNTNGLTITNGPSVLATGINAGSKKITNVSDGEANADAANYGQVKAAKTILTQGNNTQLSSTTADDGHQIYTVNVDNLSYKAGTDTTARSVTLSNGLTFQNGKNTTAVAGDNGTITYNLNDKIELGSETDSNNHIVVDGTKGLLTLGMDATINGKAGTASIGGVSIGKSGTDQVITGLTNKTWTVGTTQAVDGRAATENQLQSVADNLNNANTNIAILQHGFKVQANGDTTTESTVKADDALNFTAGDNAEVTTTKGSKQITISVDNLSVKDNNGTARSVKLADGLNFQDGTNTTAVVGANGSVTYDLKSSITLGTATDEANRIIVNGTNGTITVGNLATINGNAGTASIGGVSIGKSGSDQTVTGLSNRTWVVGTTTAVSGRAATEDQLKSVSDAADTNASNITTLQQGFTVTANGKTDTKSTVKAGETLNFQAGKNVQISTTADSKSIEVALSDTPEFTTVTAKDANGNITTVFGTGVTITPTGTGTQSVSLTSEGLDNGNHVIKNVADGTDTKDAVNKGQLDVVQTQVTNGWQITGNNGQKVADIGAGKKVTFGDTTYATASVQPDGTEGAKVTYTIKTAGLTADTATGKITEPTTDGVATAQNVAQAINNAAWNIKANNGATTAIKAGTTVGLKAGKNLTLSQSGTDFTYTLNDTLTGIKSLATVAQDGVTTTLTAGGVTIASSGTGNKSVSLTANGLNNGGKQITDVASGGDTDTNAANISDVKRLVQASASGTTETGFNVKGDDATAKKVKLGKQLNVVGGTNDTNKLSDGNIGVITTDDGQGNAILTVKLNKNIALDSVTTGSTTLNTSGVSNGDMSLTNTGLVIKNNDASKQLSVTTSGVSMGSQRIQNVADATSDTDAATLKQVKNARTVVAQGDNVKEVTSSEATDGSHQMTYTVNVDNLSVKANNEAAKSVTLKNGLTFNNGTNTTASVDDKGEVKYDLNSTLTGLTSVTAGNSTLDTNGLTIKEGTASKVVITSGNVTMGGNVIHNVGAGQVGTDAVNKDQLDALQNQVSGGWNLVGKNSDGTAVTAKIGAGKTVTYDNGNYTKAVVTKDDSNNATVKVDVTTGTFGSGTGDKAGTVTATVNGLATTQDVANAINSATINVVADNTPDNKTAVKAGDTIHFAKDDNLTLTQNGTKFTYGLSKDINISKVTTSDATKGSTVQTAEGITTTDAAGNTYIQNGQGITLTPSDETKSPVKLTNSGLNNGGNKITNVADGEVKADSQEAVNGSQLYALQQKVTNGGWDIIGENENKSTHIGNDKTVSFKSGKNSTVSVTGTDTGAEVKVDVNTAQISTDGSTHTATVTGTGLADATEVVNAINTAAWNVQKQGGTVQQVKAGDTVTFDAGDNIVLTQDGTSFTYGLISDVNTNSIRLGGSKDTNGDWTGGIFIGKQIGGGANHNEGNYITGLDNTSWDLSKVVDNRAATEAQLKAAINQITLKEQNGGFALKDESGNEKGKVSQTLGNAIAIVGDTEYESDGKTVKKAGNITTEADGTNVGGIKVKLNKNLDLSDEGSLRVGSSKVSNGAIQLGEDASANKILMDGTNGTASIGDVTVNGAEKTVNGLSNTKWTGKAVDGQAATENQLVEAINEAKTQAANSELHIKKGVYTIGKDSNGQDITDKTSKNSVSIDVVNAKGTVDGQVVINDVAKASELGTVGELADNLKNPAGGPTTVVQAVNKVNQKVDDSLKQVNGDITSAVTEAKKHTKVAHVDGDSNVIIDGTQKTDDNGTVYKLGLNKEHVDLNQVHIYGNEGRVKTKTVEAETVKIDDKTKLDKTGLTTGNTTVADGRVVVGGDNGIKIEANAGQQTVSGLSNRTWTGKAVSGRAATEDQLQQAVENATATAAQNEQHIQAGNYNVGQGKGLDGKAIGKNSVAINVVSGDGTKPGDVKGQVVINNVAKADELGNVAKLNDTVKNADGRPTSTVDAINNLDKRVETKVGDNVYSNVAGKEIADGDSATTAIGKLNNRMNDIYTTAGQHSSVSTADTNLTLSESKNTSGGTDYKIGLNKDQINLGNLTIKGNEGSIEANSIKSDSFTAGDTVVSKDGIKVGDQSALTGDSLKVNGKTYVDDKGVDANGQVIRNVGDGKDNGDAVNVKQVNDLAARQGEVIGQNAAHINQLDRAVNRLDSRINRVGAGAAALAALHPGNYDPDDKVDFAAGFGNYRGASAAAVGMYYHPDETTTMSVGASFGGGENMVNAGITWKMGKDSGHMRTQAATKAVPVQFVAAPTQTTQPTGQTEGTKTPQPVTAVTTTASGQQVPIVAAYLPSVDNSTRAENDELKELLARQTAILEKLAEQKTAAAPAAAAAPVSGEDLFPDVPENHWAYDFVAKLAQAGALKDCRVEEPANNPMLTRNDFAQILYTALKNGATKNPALNKDNGLNRLASEFRAELKNVKR